MVSCVRLRLSMPRRSTRTRGPTRRFGQKGTTDIILPESQHVAFECYSTRYGISADLPPQEVKDSTIPAGGKGLILLAPAEAHQIIARYGGAVISEREARRRKAEVRYNVRIIAHSPSFESEGSI